MSAAGVTAGRGGRAAPWTAASSGKAGQALHPAPQLSGLELGSCPGCALWRPAPKAPSLRSPFPHNSYVDHGPARKDYVDNYWSVVNW